MELIGVSESTGIDYYLLRRRVPIDCVLLSEQGDG
jgi:hypothetical protein